jgi:hypothetical protein
MEPNHIQVEPSGNLITFRDTITNCKVVFNTHDSMEYILMEFNCGNRGGGNGAKLLLYALEYVTGPNVARNKQPFRVKLTAVPESTGENDLHKLMHYYRELGFRNSIPSAESTEMDGLIQQLKTAIRSKYRISGGEKKRQHSRRRRRCQRRRYTKKRLPFRI